MSPCTPVAPILNLDSNFVAFSLRLSLPAGRGRDERPNRDRHTTTRIPSLSPPHPTFIARPTNFLNERVSPPSKNSIQEEINSNSNGNVTFIFTNLASFLREINSLAISSFDESTRLKISRFSSIEIEKFSSSLSVIFYSMERSERNANESSIRGSAFVDGGNRVAER